MLSPGLIRQPARQPQTLLDVKLMTRYYTLISLINKNCKNIQYYYLHVCSCTAVVCAQSRFFDFNVVASSEILPKMSKSSWVFSMLAFTARLMSCWGESLHPTVLDRLGTHRRPRFRSQRKLVLQVESFQKLDRIAPSASVIRDDSDA